MQAERELRLDTRLAVSEMNRCAGKLRGGRGLVRAVRAVEQSGQYAVIPYLVPLAYRRGGAAEAAARAVHSLLERMPILEFAYLDSAMREHDPGLVGSQISVRLSPRQAGRPNCPEEFRTAVIGLAACVRDGYVREAAVRELAHRRDGAEIPFLLIRANDWVHEVRTQAVSALRDRLATGDARHIALRLPLVARLGECARKDHGPLVKAIEDLISSPQHLRVLSEGLTVGDRTVRRDCMRLVVGSDSPDAVRLSRRCLRDEDPVIRLQAARHVLSNTLPGELESTLQVLSKDACMPVRREALRAWADQLPDTAGEPLLGALFDRSRPMRELAVYHLRKRGHPDVADEYRRAITTSRGMRLVSAVLGLGEVGEKEDVELVLPLFESGTPRLRRAVVRTTGRLNAKGHLEFLTHALMGDSPRVSHEALDALIPHLGSLDHERLSRDMIEHPRDHVRRDVLRLLARTSKFDSIRYAVVAAADPAAAVRRAAEDQIHRWATQYNRSLVAPSDEQLRELASALDQHATQLQPRLLEWLGDLLKQQGHS